MNAVSDVLGEEGRRVPHACVKVKIIGERLREPEYTRKYTWDDAVKRLRSCYAGESPRVVDHTWLNINDLLLPRKYDDKGKLEGEKTYDILDIHNALEKFDKKPFVEKYPSPGTGRDELKKLIDDRRTDVENEHAKAMADGNSRRTYSWIVAQRRVRDCYAGNFAGDNKSVLFCRSERKPNELYNILDIRKAVDDNMKSPLSQELRRDIPSGPGSEELRESIDKNIFDLKEEYEEAYTKIERYSKDEAVKRVNDCILGLPFPYNQYNSPLSPKAGSCVTYDIFYIYNEVQFLKDTYPTVQFKKVVWESLTKKHETTLKKLDKYTRSEAERRVRDCFPGSFEYDTDIFPHKFEQNERMPDAKTGKTYDIFDIKRSIEHFDERKLLNRFPPVNEKHPEAKKSIKSQNEKVDETRGKIREEYKKATEKVELEHGSGFIISDHYVITNKHVIDDANGKEIFISNASIIGKLSCKVAYIDDSGQDLALLYCQGLDIKKNQVAPLHLSNQPLMTGMQVFSFGYPMSHTGETALFVNGHVSGFKETYSDCHPSLVVLNLSLNSGNSGGPILCRIGNQLKVVGVATQKHFKEILTMEERETIEKIRKSMETDDISDISDENIAHLLTLPTCLRKLATSKPDPRQIPMNLLTLKLYDALETHSQFNLSNAIPGNNVIKFIEKAFKECKEEHKDELVEVVC